MNPLHYSSTRLQRRDAERRVMWGWIQLTCYRNDWQVLPWGESVLVCLERGKDCEVTLDWWGNPVVYGNKYGYCGPLAFRVAKEISRGATVTLFFGMGSYGLFQGTVRCRLMDEAPF